MSTSKTETKKPSGRKRLFYLDFIRALSVGIIVLTHFNNPYFTGGGWLISNFPFNIYIGSLGVSLFLIISATALTITYPSPLNLRHYINRRLLGIYPMFWIAWVIATLGLFLWRGGVPANGGPAWSFIFTLTAMDGLVANFGLPNMYLLGEWFLGFIILFYLVFPVLVWGVRRHPVITLVLGLGIYLLSLALVFHFHPSFPSLILLPLRLPELLFGMYFAQYLSGRHPAWCGLGVPVLVICALYPAIPEEIAVPLVGVACFGLLTVAAKFLDFRVLRVPVGLVSKYSYAIFLVHHVIIVEVFNRLDVVHFPPLYKWMTFAAVCLLSYALGVGLYHLHDRVMFHSRRAFARPQRQD